MRHRLGGAAIAIVIAACGQTRETRSVADLSRYQACRLEIDEATTKPAYRDILVDQIEHGLASQGVCEVTPSGDLVVLVKPRVRAMGVQTETGGPHAEAIVDVKLTDGATGKEIGAFSTRVDTLDESAQAMHGKNDEKALRRASEEIVTFLRSKRGGGRAIAKKGASWSPAPDPGAAPPPKAAAPAASATVAPTPPSVAPSNVPPPRGCSLQCIIPHHGAVANADEARLTSELGSTLTELHSCLGGSPGGAVLTLRFNSQSKLASMGIDVGDPPDQERPCMESLRAQVPVVSMPGPSTVRCTERCR